MSDGRGMNPSGHSAIGCNSQVRPARSTQLAFKSKSTVSQLSQPATSTLSFSLVATTSLVEVDASSSRTSEFMDYAHFFGLNRPTTPSKCVIYVGYVPFELRHVGCDNTG
jgi:hypothetical protein